MQNLSIVVPVFNEETILKRFWEVLEEVIESLGLQTEVIFIDDGSSDETGVLLQEIAEDKLKCCSVRVIQFSRNFGQEAALIAGIDVCKGDGIICMDADLQHPPDLIPKLIQTFMQGYDIIHMVRQKKGGRHVMLQFLSGLFYKWLNRISPFQFQENASDFFMISRRVGQILRKEYRERTRFIRGIIQCIGFNKTTLIYDEPERQTGKSKYGPYRLFVLTATALAGFSKLPLLLGLIFSILFTVFSVVMIIFSVSIYVVKGNTPPGYTTLIVFMSMAFALLFFLVGIIGIYIGFIFDEIKKRPIYIIKKMF